jgi:hypothetical protein
MQRSNIVKLKIPCLALALLLFWAIAAKAPTGVTPAFFARRDYSNFPTNWINVFDANGDGIPDIVGVLTSAQVLLGNGDGTFRPGPTSQTDMSTIKSAAADMNGDGKMDLVLAANGVGISFGNGDGTFQPAVFYPVADSGMYAVVIGDFNGDGILDVATRGLQGIWLFTGKGQGVLNPGVLIPFPLTVNGQDTLWAADFNKDHKLDLLVVTSTGFSVLLGNGDGTFQPPQAFSVPQRSYWISPATVGDVNGDGVPDVLLAMPNLVYLCLGNGAGGFSAPGRINLPGGSMVTIGDVNGDGIPDLVNSAGYVALGKGKGAFAPPTLYPVNTFTGTVNAVLADLRGTGRLDIVTQSADSLVSVLLNTGKGKYEDGVWTPVSGGGGCGVVADYNLDGKPDLATNNSQGIAVLLGTGKATSPFTTAPAIPLSGGCFVAGDLNGDAIPDLLVPTSSAAIAFLGKGDGSFSQKSSTPIVNGGYLALADFNRDGKLDFATSQNQLAYGNGDGTFGTPAPFIPKPPSNNYGLQNIASGDLNGDGWPDIVVSDFNQGRLFILINNRHGGFTESLVKNSYSAVADEIVLRDVNGDGHLDIVVSASDGATVFLGDGAGGFTYKAHLPEAGTSTAPASIMVADVNGDHIPDIGVMSANTLTIYLGNGDGTFQPGFSIGGGPSPSDVRAINLHGQSPLSGLADIVAPDGSGGVMALINQTK